MEIKRSSEQLSRAAQRKRRKQKKSENKDIGQWDRCMFVVVRKRRYCNIASDAVVSNKSQKFKATLRRRVPCPVDKAHTVYEFDLAKHVLICNRAKDADVMKKLPYYIHNINSGANCSDTEQKAALNNSADKTEEKESEHSALSAKEQQSMIGKLQIINFLNLRNRIEAIYASCVGDLALEKLHHNCCDKLLENKAKAGASKCVLRHIEQQSSIIGHMNRVKLFNDPTAAFVELGAGRGMLSLAVAQMLPDSLYVLIDRAHTRGKADRYIGGDVNRINSSKKSASTLRAKIDIRHLNFAGIKEILNKPIICMSKHLCGVATDLSLRAIAQTLHNPRIDRANVTEGTCVSNSLQGLAIALCCHHVCVWDDYINPRFFQEHGISPEEFNLLCSMSSWATCGMGLDGDAVEHMLGISKDERVELGRKCKRIIDAGRAAYLAQLQLNTRLVHYCDTDDSLENCLLMAWR